MTEQLEDTIWRADLIDAEWIGDPHDDCRIRLGEWGAHAEAMNARDWWACVFYVDPACARMFKRARGPLSRNPKPRSQAAKHQRDECACWEINAATIGLFWPGGRRGGLAARRWCEWMLTGVAELLRGKERS